MTCSIPKVGTTFMKTTVGPRLDQWAEAHPREAAEGWTHNKSSIVFVREPYSRSEEDKPVLVHVYKDLILFMCLSNAGCQLLQKLAQSKVPKYNTVSV